MSAIFQYLSDTEELSAIEAMTRIVDWLRPGRGEDSDDTTERMLQLQEWLQNNPDTCDKLAQCLQTWLEDAVYFDTLTTVGILSRRGFSREFAERLYERINPSPPDHQNVRDAIALVFHRKDDHEWVSALSTETWITFFSILWRYDRKDLASLRYKVCSEVLYAIEMLSIWVAAEELDAEIARLDDKVVARDSAFVAQQRELATFIRHYEKWLDKEADFYDDDHARVLLDQCDETLTLLRKRMVVKGTSVTLTHLLERLNQTLGRIELLLDSLTVREREAFNERAIELFSQLITASNQRHSISVLWRQNSRLLARSVTENASHHGEGYVSADRKGYARMLLAGIGGGFIIAFMALLKIQIISAGFTTGTETLLSSLNYGLGFMLIHMVGFTVATKQPAMTAAHFANAVEQGAGGRANASKLADLLVQVSRSQFAAIIGNVSIALSLAYLLSRYAGQWLAAPLLEPETARYLFYKLDITETPALLHAAIAGVWLFVSGLVAGYFDNRAARIELEARMAAHPLLNRLLPRAFCQRLAHYVEGHYGALMGNFVFGVLLGTTGYVGMLMGLPLDIRHVAFASADLGFGAGTIAIDAQQWAFLGACVLLIGTLNLWVSFSLALAVALRARGTKIPSFAKLAKALWLHIRRQPLALVFPPTPAPPEATEDGEQQDDAKDGKGASS